MKHSTAQIRVDFNLISRACISLGQHREMRGSGCNHFLTHCDWLKRQWNIRCWAFLIFFSTNQNAPKNGSNEVPPVSHYWPLGWDWVDFCWERRLKILKVHITPKIEPLLKDSRDPQHSNDIHICLIWRFRGEILRLEGAFWASCVGVDVKKWSGN